MSIVRTNSRSLCVVLSLAALLPLTGCMTKPATHVRFYGPAPVAASTPALAFAPTAPRFRLASLGAGDELGHTLYQNDVYLAYLEQVSSPLRLGSVPTAP